MIDLKIQAQKIILAGGSGLLGERLARHFDAAGWEVIILSRSVLPRFCVGRWQQWDGCTAGPWMEVLEGAAAIVNLSGRSIYTRFTARNRRVITDSRVLSTQVLGEAIRRRRQAPRLWINAEGIAIYRPSAVLRSEADQPDGTDFLAQVAHAWERAFFEIGTPATRKVILRISLVMTAGGGGLQPLRRIARLGLGGPIGSGDQYVSWIHEHDFVRLVDWLIHHDRITGAVHACSPHPVPNRELMAAIRAAQGVPVGIPSPTWLTRLGACVVGVAPEPILTGRKVVSTVLQDAGFTFEFPEIRGALHNLIV